jgi:CcmD family protein
MMTARSEGRAIQVVMKALITFVWSLCLTMPALAFQQPPIEGFEPVDQLPPSEQLPAAPLLVAAYAFAWLAVFFYVWTVWRRLNKVEAEMRVFEKRQSQRGNSR